MSSSLDHKCQRCGSQYHGQICPFCTITGLDVNALLASEGLSMPASAAGTDDSGSVTLVDVVSNRVFPVNPPVCRLGRDISNDIVLTGDKSLSRFHFQITQNDQEYFVEDAGSRNGTFLNGSPVTSARKVLNGDIISAGMSRYRFVIGGEELPNAESNGADSGYAAEGNGHEAAAAESQQDPADKLFEEGKSLLAATESQLDEAEAEAEQRVDTGEHEQPGVQQPMPIESTQAEPAAATTLMVNEPAGGNWPEWCTTFTFKEIDALRMRAESLQAEIDAKQRELFELSENLNDVESCKNRLLATKDSGMVNACADVFRMLGWETALNAGSDNELVLSDNGNAVAVAKVVCTIGEPKPNELANLVSSLSTYWCDHGVEPKGILLVAFILDGPPGNRPELTRDYADYAQKKNVCLMDSLQLLEIYRQAALCDGDKEAIKAQILSGSGQLKGFELTATTKS